MTTYLVTGGTGFLGRHLLERLLRRPDATVHVLVREASTGRLAALAAGMPGGERISPLVGDLSLDGLGLTAARRKRLGRVDHVVHLAALYDLTADDEANHQTNVEGTRRIVELAAALRAGCLHHVSSVAVAGEFAGFTGLAWSDVTGTRELEVGWRLAHRFWGRGLATEAAAAALAHGLTVTPRVISFTALTNERSWRLMERIGMRREREFDHPRADLGHLRRHVLYSS